MAPATDLKNTDANSLQSCTSDYDSNYTGKYDLHPDLHVISAHCPFFASSLSSTSVNIGSDDSSKTINSL